jgi:hypothetical protein
MKRIYKTLRLSAILLAIPVSMEAQQTYCNSTALYNYDEEIYNVMVNGAVTNPLYSFSNGCSTPAPGPGSNLGLYSNFVTLGALTSLIQGASTTFSVFQDECDGATYYPNGIGIWIDYNGNGVFTDPGENVYLESSTSTGPRSISGTFVVPISATTGTTVMRVICAEGYSGSSLTSCLNNYGYGETEDYRIDILPAVPCSGIPGGNTVITPTNAICPGANANLTLANNYTTTGITYQWMSSTTSSVGPYTAVPNGTNGSLTTPTLGAGTWFQVVITCTNGGGSVTATPSMVLVQNTTTNTVPYCEGFEGITGNNKLPNCSWNATNLGTRALTYQSALNQNRVPHNGSKFASFYYSPSGQSDFFSNGIWLDAGVTYSASVWYTTDYYSYTNWTSLQLLVGSAQSTTGMVPIATASPAASPAYKPLSNTFQVSTSGLYYIDVRGTSSGACCGYYLTWDDLCITIPCSLNTPTLGVTASATTICKGQSVNLTASGATSYTWNTGANTSNISDTPNGNYTYVVTGENGSTGCTATMSQQVIVNPTPDIGIFVDKPTVCSGSPANLTAFGAVTYSWNTGSNNQSIVVNPTSMTIYTVSGSNTYNCTSFQTTTVNVNSLPTVIVGGPATICSGESAVLTGSGAVTYQWMSSSIFITANPVQVNPTTSIAYTVAGTDANGCMSTAIFNLAVDPCTGVNELNGLQTSFVYPNPTSGIVTVIAKKSSMMNIELYDISGRRILTDVTSGNKVEIDLSEFTNGIYYLKITSENSAEVFKIVKE